MPDESETSVTDANGSAPARRQRLGGLLGVLKHPLFLLLAGTIIGSIVVPRITDQWQDRQKENDLKQSLLEQVSTSSTTAVREGVSLAQGNLGAAGGQESEAKGDVYAELRNSWLINRAAARSRIIVYFPGLYPCWYGYERAVADFLSLGSGDSSKTRVDELKSYVGAGFATSYTGPGKPSGALPATTTTAPGTASTGGGDDGCRPLTALPVVVQQRFAQLSGLVKWNALEQANGETTAPATTPAAPPATAPQQTGTTAFRNAYAILAEALLIGMERIVYSIEKTPAQGFDHGL